MVCAGDAGARVGSIAARCEMSRSNAVASCVLSLVCRFAVAARDAAHGPGKSDAMKEG
jgi:hypothetical protein